MGRAPCCEKNGLKKGPWTPEEDKKLIDYIQKHGHGSWRTLPKNAGLHRCGKSCRLRWNNYLRPDIKRGRFSFEEEETIIQLHSILGNKWSAIAARLPGRTDNEIKNYWNTHIRKRLLRMGIDPVTHSPRLDLLDLSSILNSPLYNPSQLDLSRLLSIQPLVNPGLLRLATTLLSSQNENRPEFLLQNLHENQLCNPQLPNDQFASFPPNQLPTNPIQEIPVCTTSTTPWAPFLDETQLLQTNVEKFPSNPTSFSCPTSQTNLWQHNEMPCNFQESFVSLPNFSYVGSDHPTAYHTLLNNSIFQSNNNSSSSSSHDFGFTSVLSTPSSSTAPLNSSSTNINSSTEDERDSYCSNMLKFEIPDLLDVNEFM